MIDAAIKKFGQPALWCYECKKQSIAQTGKSQCSQAFGKCLYPVPKLSVEDNLVLYLFQMCQTQWIRVAGFSHVRRTGIPFSDVKAAAQYIGVKLTRRRILKFIACVNAIVNEDLKTIAETQNSK